MAYTIEFSDTAHAAIELSRGAVLSHHLTVRNSPLLFGCHTGICGTCLVQVEQGREALSSPGQNEQEALEVYAPGNHKARLACQIFLDNNIALRKIESA